MPVMSATSASVFPRLKTLHYLFYPSTDEAIAHCLDLDIIATGPDMKEAERRLDVLVVYYIEEALKYGNYAALDKPAPNSEWAKFESGKPMEPLQKQALRFNIPEVVPMESTVGHIPVIRLAA